MVNPPVAPAGVVTVPPTVMSPYMPGVANRQPAGSTQNIEVRLDQHAGRRRRIRLIA
jgi:hypothetical protein